MLGSLGKGITTIGSWRARSTQPGVHEQVRLLLLQKTDANRPWNGLEIKVHQNEVVRFDIALQSQVDNGNNTTFWSDRWLMGCLTDLAPNVVATMPPKTQLCRTVEEAIMNQSWPVDIRGGFSLIGKYEYFQFEKSLHHPSNYEIGYFTS